MPSAVKPSLLEVRQQVTRIHQALAAVEYRSSGTLHKRTKVCGNPNCRCASDRAARHGPYYEWGYVKGGRLRHRTLTPQQAALTRLAIGNYRKVKKLLRV